MAAQRSLRRILPLTLVDLVRTGCLVYCMLNFAFLLRLKKLEKQGKYKIYNNS